MAPAASLAPLARAMHPLARPGGNALRRCSLKAGACGRASAMPATSSMTPCGKQGALATTSAVLRVSARRTAAADTRKSRPTGTCRLGTPCYTNVTWLHRVDLGASGAGPWTRWRARSTPAAESVGALHMLSKHVAVQLPGSCSLKAAACGHGMAETRHQRLALACRLTFRLPPTWTRPHPVESKAGRALTLTLYAPGPASGQSTRPP